MSAIALRCAQQGSRCPAPGNGSAKLCPEPERQEPGPVGSISPNDGSSLAQLLVYHQPRRKARARKKECPSPLEPSSRYSTMKRWRRIDQSFCHQRTSPPKGGRRSPVACCFAGRSASLESASNLELTLANTVGFPRSSLVTKSSTELRGGRSGEVPTRGAVRFEYVPNAGLVEPEPGSDFSRGHRPAGAFRMRRTASQACRPSFRGINGSKL